MRGPGPAAVALLASLYLPAGAAPSPAGAPPAKKKAPDPHPGAAGGPTDFSGTWEVDEKSSSLGSHHMENAVLQVTQKGDRIWIQPVGRTRQLVMAEEVVVDGRTYEKSLGNSEKGTLTAMWGKEGRSLWLEVVAGTEADPRAGVQRSVWRLSADRSVWVRETITVHKGSSQRARVVFRRQDPKKPKPEPTPRFH